jgi:hypothetical protein
MIEALVAMYRKGAITADHLVVQSLGAVDPAEPALILDALPRELLTRVDEFVKQYRPGEMVANYGSVPEPSQVSAARKWLERKFHVLPAHATRAG